MSEQPKQKYLNFPVQLLNGFMVDCRKCLNDIADYALVKHSQSMKDGSALDKLSASYEAFGLLGAGKESLKNGQILIDSLPYNSPISGVSVKVWLDFYRNDKSDFEKVCLLAFLSMKSIIGDKPYCKMTNAYFLSRMDGKTKAVRDFSELSPEIRKYANEYQAKKLRFELSKKSWGMAFYGRATKGFYASTKLDINELTFQVLKSKQTDKYQEIKEAAKNAEIKAKIRLCIAPP